MSEQLYTTYYQLEDASAGLVIVSHLPIKTIAANYTAEADIWLSQWVHEVGYNIPVSHDCDSDTSMHGLSYRRFHRAAVRGALALDHGFFKQCQNKRERHGACTQEHIRFLNNADAISYGGDPVERKPVPSIYVHGREVKLHR